MICKRQRLHGGLTLLDIRASRVDPSNSVGLRRICDKQRTVYAERVAAVGRWCLVALPIACASSSSERTASSSDDRTALERASFEACAPARAAGRVHNPHDCFRALSEITARLTCNVFKDYRLNLPAVDRHGDPHVEQIGFNGGRVSLLDYDDAARGLFVVDLARALGSLALARHLVTPPPTFEDVTNHFLDTYEAALLGPAPLKPLSYFPPADEGQRTRLDLLTHVDALIEPFDSDELRNKVEAGFARYIALLRQVRPELAKMEFRTKKMGLLRRTGIGSLQSTRILARIEGATTANRDDVVLEAKEVRFWDSVSCVRRDVVGIPLRTRIFEGAEDKWAALVPRDPTERADDPPWWIQSWAIDYRELQLRRDVTTAAELLEATAFLARALARAHIGGPPFTDRHIAYHLRHATQEHRQRLVEVAHRIETLVERTTRWSGSRLSEERVVHGPPRQ